MNDRGTKDQPLFMAVLPPDIKMRQLVFNMALTAIPVALAIIMQKPALRQAIVMRVSRDARNMCRDLSDFFLDMSLKAGTMYQKARM